MASSDNLAAVEPWSFRPTFADSWFSDTLARDAEAFTKALQKSLSAADSPFTTPSSAVSSLSGSDHETPHPKRQTTTPTGRVSKRKSRASKKSLTTFIAADPANFRQMVQQVTGARLDSSQIPMPPILKPEPQRAGGRFLPSSACGGGILLPTLDTSASLLDQLVGPSSADISGPGPLGFDAGGLASTTAIPTLDFDTTFPSFPTLDSWKAL